MNYFRVAWLTLFCSSLLLSGCDAISGLGTDNAPPPAPLKTLAPGYTVITHWLTQANKGVGSDYLLLGPAVSAGRIWSSDAKGNVTCLDAHSGRTLLSIATHAPITSGPVVGAGLVVVGTADAHVLALDELTGQTRWRVKISNQLLAPPQIGQGRVIVNTLSGKLSALSAATGQLLWTYEHAAPTLVLRGGSLPQIADNKVIAGFADGKLAAFNLADGHLLWQTAIAMPRGTAQVEQMVDIVADPRVADGMIYVATFQGNLAAVSLSAGQIKWTTAISSYTGIAITSQQLIVTDSMGRIWAFARDDGRRLWLQTALQNRQLTAPQYVDGYVVVGDGAGYLHWLDGADGHLIARTLLAKDKALLAPPVVDNHTVFAATRSGLVAATTLASVR